MITDQEKSIDDITLVSSEEIPSLEQIDDDTESESTQKEPYSIRSYGADYTVDSLVKRMDTEAFIVPSFQRRFVWNQIHASRFIESLLMGLPVPGIFLYKRPEDGRQLVVDGQQRLKTLQGFYGGLFKERKFRLTGVRAPWNGLTYEELGFDDQLRLDDSIVHAVIFSQESPRDSIDSIHFVFERINSGSTRLSAQEIRNCIAEGPFNALTGELNHNEDWRKIYGTPSTRAKDQELITRVLAFFECPDDYKRPMATFLTKFTLDMNNETTQKLQSLRATFEDVCALSWEALKNQAFRPVRAINAAVLESVMSALARRLQDPSPSPTAHAARGAYEELLSSDRYRLGWESGTADEEKVRIRVELARQAFSSL